MVLVVCDSYLSQVLVQRVDVGLLDYPSFYSILFLDQRPVWVRANSVKPKVRIVAYLKLNASLFVERDFQDQLLLMLERELTVSVVGNTR